MPTCAECEKKPCRRGNLDGAPVNCPSKGVSCDMSLTRYSDDDMRTAKVAALVEARGYGKWPRIMEIMQYAWGCGYKRLGLAFCVGLSKEAKTVSKILRSNGFEVESVCCKNGAVPKELLSIEKQDMVAKGTKGESMCNPAGQAAVLDEAGCELNILLGLCVGHDTLFIKNSKAPVTVLAAKDRTSGHSPLSSIYTADSYCKYLYEVERQI